MINQPIETNEIETNEAVSVFDELASVVSDINAFLQNFIDRFESIQAESPTSIDSLKEVDDSADTREEWDIKRLLAEQKIREQVELLTNAWLRLEEEQRALLETKKGLAVELSSRAEKKAVGIGSPVQCLPGTSHFSTKTEQSAVFEFERLRREIQANRPKAK